MIFYITGPDHSGKTTLSNELVKLRKANYIHCTYNKNWNLEDYHDDIGQIAKKINNYGQDVVLDRWCLDAYPYRFVNQGNTYNPRNLWNSFIKDMKDNLILIYCLPTNEFDPNKREEMFNNDEMKTVEQEFNNLFSNVNHYKYFYKTDGNDMKGFIERCIELHKLCPLDYTWKDPNELCISKNDITILPYTNDNNGFRLDNIMLCNNAIKTVDLEGKVDEKSFDYSKLPKCVAVDFDGTLSLNASFPECGDLNTKLANELYSGKYKDYKKILFTNRTGQALEDAVKWCNDQGIVFDAINDNVKEVKEAGLNPVKPWFDVMIDDKVINVKDI